MNQLRLLYLVVVFFCSEIIYAQDIHFSNWAASPLISAPPLSGNFNGNLRILGNFRNQWRSVTTPYKTVAVSAEGREIIHLLPQLQSGLSISRDMAGDSRWITTQAHLILSYRIPLNPKLTIIPLLGSGLTQQRYSDDNLQFDQQWNGTYYDPSIQSGENYNLFNNRFWQGHHGVSLEHNGVASTTLLGYSMQINSTTNTSSGYDDQRSARTTLLALHRSSIRDDIAIEPSIHIQLQRMHRSILTGVRLYKKLDTGNWHRATAYAGVSVRIADAFIPAIGIEYDQWLGGISYDINLSQLRIASRGRGSAEIFIGTILKKLPHIEPASYCRPLY